ncbi:hypothetical protein ACTXT7_014130 [Hymenolepis weldensis]
MFKGFDTSIHCNVRSGNQDRTSPKKRHFNFQSLANVPGKELYTESDVKIRDNILICGVSTTNPFYKT